MKEYTTLEKVALIYNGNSINAEYKKQHFVGLKTGYPFIGTKDVSFEGVVDYNNGVRIPYNTDYKTAEPDSVFICAEGGSAGRKIAYINEKVCFGNKLFCIKPKKNLYIGKFLYYYLMSNAFQTQFKLMLTGLIGGVSAKKFKSFTIPILEITEQERIVAFLDAEFEKIDQLKANAAAQLQAAKDLFQAALKEMLTPKEKWVEYQINNVISDLRTGLNPRVHFKLNTPDADCYYITVRELKGFTIETDEKTDLVNKSAIERINQRSHLQIGDVLFSATGTIGNTALVTEVPENWNIKEGIYVMTPLKSMLDSKFFIYLLGSDYFLRSVRAKAEGTGVKSIAMKNLIKLPIALPPLPEQQRIAERLDAISDKVKALQSNYDQTLTLCNDLKQALLKSIFE